MRNGTGTASARRVGRLALLLALIALVVAAAACGGSSGGAGVAQSGSPASASQTSSSHGSTKKGPLAFSQCMRAHGITNFPDPGRNGAIQVQGGPSGGLDPNSSQFQAAQQACQSLIGGKNTGPLRGQHRDEALRFSRCMRAHGIKDFPDPSSQGNGIRIQAGGDLDPNSPLFQSAQQACQKYLPGHGKGLQRINGPSGGGSAVPSGGPS
jgi:hypothetical protein